MRKNLFIFKIKRNLIYIVEKSEYVKMFTNLSSSLS